MAKTAYDKIKKNLPNDFAKKVVEDVGKHGITINRQYVYDLLRDRKKESELTLKVWISIRKLEKDQKRLKKIQAKTKKKTVTV